MKYFLANFGVNLVALSCIGASIYLIVHDKTDWRWFLFVGVVCAGSVGFKNKK